MGKQKRKGYKGSNGNRGNKGKQRKPLVMRPEVVFTQSQLELLCELQERFRGLYALSAEYDHKLLDAISCRIYERLTHISNSMQREMTNFHFTSAYRARHPHRGDFALIETELRRVELDLGRPHKPVTEEELLKQLPDDDRLEIVDVRSAMARILTPIKHRVKTHINNLETALSNTTDGEATSQVRLSIKKNLPFVEQLLYESVLRGVLPDRDLKNADLARMKIYGEPHMPSRDEYIKLIGKFRPLAIMHSRRLFNCVLVTIKPQQRASFLALDGTTLGTAKIIARDSVQPKYKIQPFILQKIKEFFGIAGPPIELDDYQQEDMDVGDGEESE